jgi:hypothetical protein
MTSELWTVCVRTISDTTEEFHCNYSALISLCDLLDSSSKFTEYKIYSGGKILKKGIISRNEWYHNCQKLVEKFSYEEKLDFNIYSPDEIILQLYDYFIEYGGDEIPKEIIKANNYLASKGIIS